MPAPTPQYTIAKPGGGSTGGGILPISAATNASDKPAPKAPPQRLKVLVRRLPPGLTQAEFEFILGDEWKLGSGKVSWFLYRPGKVSKDLSKPSRPSRAYFQLSQAGHLEPLADKIRNSSFLDARNTANDASLLAPPALEFAPYARVPLSRKRHDARQGLVDQDPEFIAFLESLTDPISKPPPIDSAENPPREPEDTAKVTPLIQYLKNKKAAKEAAKDKEKTAKKESKHNRQASKAETTPSSIASGKSAASNAKATPDGPEKKSTKPTKADKASKAAAKQSKKEQQSQPQPEQQPKAKPAAGNEASVTPVKEPTPKRAEKSSSATSAAKIIQRDLGIKGRGGARVRAGRQAAEQDAPAASTGSEQPAPSTNDKQSKPPDQPDGASVTDPTSPTSPKPTSTSTKPLSNPSILKREDKQPQSTKAAQKQPPTDANAQQMSSTQAPARSGKSKANAKPQTITPNATQAFLKHANPSQGITEPLLTTALSEFGQVSHVEIDKRKGFAYVDFVDHEGLKNAIAASPVKVAQGSVQVLERKDRPAAGASNRGGSAAAAKSTAAAGATANTNNNTSTGTPASPTSAAATPSGSRTGGSRGVRGRGRGGASARNNANAAAATTVATTTVEAKSPAPASSALASDSPAEHAPPPATEEASSSGKAEISSQNAAAAVPAATSSDSGPVSALPDTKTSTLASSPPLPAVTVTEDTGADK